MASIRPARYPSPHRPLAVVSNAGLTVVPCLKPPAVLIVLTMLIGVLSVSASAEGAATPGWATRYLERPPEPWDGWRNALAPEGEAAPPLALAVEGETDYVIVIPAEPTTAESRAADELQLWLGLMTGAEFPIAPDTEPARGQELSVGNTTRLAEDELAQPVVPDAEGYTIAVRGERLFLFGSGPRGPMPAVFALLEEDLGVRWYSAPGMVGEGWDARIQDMNDALNAPRWAPGERSDLRVPHAPSLRASIVPRSRRPAVRLRHLSFQLTSMPWGLRNRLNGGWATQYSQFWYVHGGAGVHTFHWLVPPARRYDEHPEYFSLVDGERQWENAQLCLSNPEVAEVAAATAISALRSAAPTRRMMGVSAMDWGGHCECDECRAVEQQTGAWSGLLLQFVNRVAELVAREVPDATITTLSYWNSNRPPTADTKARENVAIRFCLDWGASFTWPYHSFYDDTLAAAPSKPGDRWTAQQQSYARWRGISPRMHLWMYPSQYRHTHAPMPSLRPVAENIRYFAEQQAESIYVQFGGSDKAREPMRNWVIAKLLWDPELDVDALMQDFIWGYYGQAAPDVLRYHQLLWDHCARYTDFSLERDWIYAIHNEAMYQHGFVETARAVLAEAAANAQTDAVRRRVELLTLGVVYVESAQLYMQMRDGETPPDVARYAAIADELEALCAQLDVDGVGFYDGSRTISSVPDWIAAVRKAHEQRFDQRYLPVENWGAWTFRWDPDDQGVTGEWFRAATGDEWQPVTVPAFLADTPAGNAEGYGWYRTSFTLPEDHVGKPVELRFGGVDEQAWVYVNGQPVGEHTLESEFMVGQEITVADLWERPFEIAIEPGLLKAGENALAVRIHNSAFNAGIHRPVRAYLPEAAFRDACDGAVLDETFADVKNGDIPAAWKRQIQERDGQVFGIAEVSRHFVRGATLHLRDQRSHVAVWSTSDEALPAGKQWAVQFDFRLTGKLMYHASDAGDYGAAGAGALFGLKRGEPGSTEFLPLAQLDNGESAGTPVSLLGLGEILATDLPADRWHRLVIHRDGSTWRFYLNDELMKTVVDRDTDLRGYAFGSFVNWPHVAEDVHYARFKIGNFVAPRR